MIVYTSKAQCPELLVISSHIQSLSDDIIIIGQLTIDCGSIYGCTLSYYDTSLETRLTITNFLQSCEKISGTESLGLRLL